MVIWDLSNKTLREELIGTYPGPDLPRVAPGSFPARRMPLGPIAAAAPPLAPSPPRLGLPPRRRLASVRSASVRCSGASNRRTGPLLSLVAAVQHGLISPCKQTGRDSGLISPCKQTGRDL